MSDFSKYDSAFCANIPIHIINTIQPYGVLVVVDKVSRNIVQVSDNVAALLGESPAELLGKPVQPFIPLDDLPDNWLTQPGQYNIATAIRSLEHELVVHVTTDLLLLEIDLDQAIPDEQSFSSFYQEIKYHLADLENAEDQDSLCRKAADILKQLSGFDKVMIYSFDEDWNGTVLAEAMEPGMEPYFGFTFPAADIPKPARELYLRNTYRCIPDREATLVPLFPKLNPVTGGYLDMSECNLRGVAAVHLEYLKNMKVGASMSVRLLSNGALWGLIACHHKTARTVDSQLKAVFELFSGVISARITAIENIQFHQQSSRLNSLYAALLENVYRKGELAQAFLSDKPDLCHIFEADGVIFTYQGQVYEAGETIGTDQLEQLLLWLHVKQLRKIYQTDSLPGVYEFDEEKRPLASGLLVIPVNAIEDEYVLLFRKEFMRTTNWGGNPSERLFFEEDPLIYHPRYSFELWKEYIRNTSKPWSYEEQQLAENLRTFMADFTSGRLVDINY